MAKQSELFILPGVRTPFGRADGALAVADAIQLSVPVVQAMFGQLSGKSPDLTVWGAVIPNLSWSNIARETGMDACVDAHVPAFSTTMACSTSMVGAIAAAGMLGRGGTDLALVGGVESMSHVQIGLKQSLSDWLRKLLQARSAKERAALLLKLRARDLGLFIPKVRNRSSGRSMGEHTEDMAKAWNISRQSQDELALASHERVLKAYDDGFFSDLLVPFGKAERDQLPRPDTSLAKLASLQPAFDRVTGLGTLTAGNSTALSDGAASVWIANGRGAKRLPSHLPRVRLIDWEIGAIDIRSELLLMAPAYLIPRLLARHGLVYGDIDLWEIHEAFAAQVLTHIRALGDREFVKRGAKVDRDLGEFPRERVNPNGGSIALGHPFAATGARILSQAAKELSAMPSGSRAVVSICADGGEGTVALLEAA